MFNSNKNRSANASAALQANIAILKTNSDLSSRRETNRNTIFNSTESALLFSLALTIYITSCHISNHKVFNRDIQQQEQLTV